MQALREIFGPAGPLSQALTEFRARRGQRQMAEEVAAAIDARAPLLVEAGTGIGKTFAYLVPALLSGRRCVISTGTRTLQDQLFGRDLPLLARALGRAQRVVLLKGRSNYLCLERLQRHTDGLPLPGAGATLVGRVAEWAGRTRSGDLAELPELSEGHPARSHFVSTRDSCGGQRCAEFARCHVFAARRAAAEADIVVVNHHLLLADLALKEEGWGDILPTADAVILDEAHQLPELAAQFFGRSFGSRQVDSLLQDLRAAAQASGLGVRAFETHERALQDALAGAGTAVAAALRPGQRAAWHVAPAALDEEAARLAAALRGLGGALEGQGQDALRTLQERAQLLGLELDALLEAGESEGARVIERGQAGFSLHLLPFEVATRFAAMMKARPSAWVFTSATLCVAGDFTHFSRALGIAPEARAVQLPSPFDYASQAILYLPGKLPDPTDPAYTDAACDTAAELVEASGGGAFLLFTSHRALERAAQRLRHRWVDLDSGELRFNLLVQGEAQRDRLLQTFRATHDAVLLGTASFWEGVDVKGPSLRLVVIDRLPFASPEDPLTRARIDHLKHTGHNPFVEFQLPDAAIALKQGVGRLIRGEDDAGLVAICDPRLTSRRYGPQLIASLPPFRVTRRREDALEWLRALDPSPAVVR
jgi:ATP-dependent DNA helicase DinG